MAVERGEYRGIRRALLDGPDYQALSSHARFVFLALKINAGPAGLELEYRDSSLVKLALQCGISTKNTRTALNHLQDDGWVEWEGNVMWLKGHLTFEPSMTSNDGKHRKGMQRYVAGLPRLSIVRRFVGFHPEWFPQDEASANGLEWVWQGPSEAVGSTENRRQKTEDRRQKTETKEALAAAPSLAAQGSGAALESLKLPKEAVDFLAMFYEPAMTESTRQRYRAVQSQLWDTLSPNHPGPKIRGGIRVKARSEQHLRDTCAAVMADPPNDRDAAIVFVLKRLTNPEKGPSEAERAAESVNRQIQADTAEFAERKRRAVAWARDPANAKRYAEIERQIAQAFPDNGVVSAMARDAALVARCCDAADTVSTPVSPTESPKPSKPPDDSELQRIFATERIAATKPWTDDDDNRAALATIIADANEYCKDYLHTNWGKVARDNRIIELVAAKVDFPNFDAWKRARTATPVVVTNSQKEDRP